MSALGYKVGTLTIPSGQTTSQQLSVGRSHGEMKTLLGPDFDMAIFAPAALTGAVHVEVSPEKDATAGSFVTMVDGTGADVVIPAGKAMNLPAATFRDLRLVSASAEAADRVFTLYQQEWTT
jgi:hypothetical protein